MLGKSGETIDLGHARIAVVEVISTLTQNHRNSKTQWFVGTFQPAFHSP
jgi:hypothetical protein